MSPLQYAMRRTEEGGKMAIGIKKGLPDPERESASTPSRRDRPQPAQGAQRACPPQGLQGQAKPQDRCRRRA